MAVKTEKLRVRISADGGMADITGQVDETVKRSGLRGGTVTVFIPGATGSVSTIEYEPGLLKDFPQAMERIAPLNIDYKHHKTWGDDNGRSHVKATLMGPSLVVPFVDGKLMLGTWQQITVVNFDTRERDREIILQIMGE
ncbi:MAG: secondary thiamine-phosphate synthase enzyme YjbQ [Candidatus Altiarchaeota archaeon]|nr:secondary thiamine-phosphate synthase enzyme YjbQ [Candidatus Altiarchaeota archaeon]